MGLILIGIFFCLIVSAGYFERRRSKKRYLQALSKLRDMESNLSSISDKKKFK